MKELLTIVFCMLATLTQAQTIETDTLSAYIKLQFNECLALQHQGKQEEAEEMGLEALDQLVEMTEEESDSLLGLVISSYMQLGELYKEMESYEESESCFKIAAAITCDLYDEERVALQPYLEALESLVSVQYLNVARKEEDSYIPSFNREIPQPKFQIGKNTMQNLGYNGVREKLGRQYQSTGDYLAAIKHLVPLMASYEPLPEDASATTINFVAWVNLATADCYAEIDSLQQADIYYEKALGYYERIEGSSSESSNHNHIYTLRQQAAAYARQGLYNESCRNLAEALRKTDPLAVGSDWHKGMLADILAALSFGYSIYGEQRISECTEEFAQNLKPGIAIKKYNGSPLERDERTEEWMADANWTLARFLSKFGTTEIALYVVDQSLRQNANAQKTEGINWVRNTFSDKWESSDYPNIKFTPKEVSPPMQDSLFYVFNVASGLFLNGGNGFGTQASVDSIGVPFRFTIEQSPTDPSQIGWGLSATTYDKYLFYEGDGYSFIDLKRQKQTNPDCYIWKLKENGDGSYKIQITPSCQALYYYNGNLTFLTDYVYDPKTYFCWISNGTNRETGAPTNSAVMPGIDPEKWTGGIVGANWKFLTVSQYNDQRAEYLMACQQAESEAFKSELLELLKQIVDGSENRKKTEKEIKQMLSNVLKQSQHQ